MKARMNRYAASVGGTLLVALVAAAPSFAAADSNLTSTTTSIRTYFTDNIGTIVTLFVGIAVFLWLLAMAVKSVGVRKPKSVGS
jgi:hypothetical protein